MCEVQNMELENIGLEFHQVYFNILLDVGQC